MRRFLVVSALLVLLLPLSVQAGSLPRSTIRFSHSLLVPGTAQTVTVVARDLSGNPLRRARVVLVVQLATRTAHIRMKPTNTMGVSTVVLHPSASLRGTSVRVIATISTGALSIPVMSTFKITSSGPGASAPAATPTRTIDRTPTPGRTAAPGGPIAVTVEPVPASATAPSPIWIDVHVADAGRALPHVPVQATAVFSEGVIPVTGTTDGSGSAALRVDTTIARGSETVHVTASATWEGQTAFGATDAGLTVPATPIPTPTATFVPTIAPTNTPVPPPSDVPSPANTPVPTDTPVPTLVPTSTPVPTPTVPTSCNGETCMGAVLDLLNNTRAQYGLGPLTLDLTQSNGTATCVGSIGHSEAMQQSGTIWHVNAAYPAASFPNNNCYYGGFNSPAVGQNVGMMQGPNEMNDLVQIHNLMMSEPHTPGCTGNHACTILSTTYQRVGIGIVFVNGAAWLTEDFIS